MTIRIHIGAHKTATTEMQRALRSVRTRLADAGTPFVGPGGLRGRWISLPRAMQGDDPEAQGRAERRLRRWLGKHEHHVLSEENILGSVHRRRIFGPENQLYPHAVDNITKLRALMGNPEVELFLSIRDPAEFVTSAYGQVLREGVAMGMEDYVDGYDVPALSWADLARRLTGCPGVTRVICWRYEDYAQMRPRVLSHLLGDDLAAEVPPMAIHNAGISEAAFQQFLTWVLDDSIDVPFVELLSQACAAHPKAPGDVGMRPLPPEIYAQSRETYVQDVAALAGVEGVMLLMPETGGDSDKPG